MYYALDFSTPLICLCISSSEQLAWRPERPRALILVTHLAACESLTIVSRPRRRWEKERTVSTTVEGQREENEGWRANRDQIKEDTAHRDHPHKTSQALKSEQRRMSLCISQSQPPPPTHLFPCSSFVHEINEKEIDIQWKDGNR